MSITTSTREDFPHALQPIEPPPRKFRFVSCPNSVLNPRPPLLSKPHMDFNSMKFFVFEDKGEKNYIESGKIRSIFRNPLSTWEDEITDLMMENTEGIALPAHLPAISDLTRMSILALLVFQYVMDVMDANDEVQIFPTEWVDLIDPEPVVREFGCIFMLKKARCVVANAPDSHAFEVFHVTDHISNFLLVMWSRLLTNEKVTKKWVHVTRIDCNMDETMKKIPLHSSIVVWNVRGVNRLKFADRFKLIFKTHTPVVLVLTETRCFDHQFECLYRDLECTYEWVSKESCGLLGVFIVLWDSNKLDLHPFTILDNDREVLCCAFKVSETSSPNTELSRVEEEEETLCSESCMTI